MDSKKALKALQEIAAFAEKYQPLDGHFFVEQNGGRQRGRHVSSDKRRTYVSVEKFDQVRRRCRAGDIIRLLEQIKELVQELERENE